MKKLLSILIVLALLSIPVLGHTAAGTCKQKVTFMPNSPMAVLTFTCTASSTDGSFPSTATDAAVTSNIKGYYITEVRTNPGSTAPQALYDIVINDANGIDLMGGMLADRSATVSQSVPPAIATGLYWPRAVNGVLTLVITNNNVNSAITVIEVFLDR